MTSLKSAVPPVSGKREYDPEIKDIANYIHNVSIDSELAVWPIDRPFEAQTDTVIL